MELCILLFSSRFNHFIGLNDREGLKKLYSQVISLTLPIVVFTITTILLLVNPLILAWVGPEYASSVGIARYLIACNLFAFISYPCGLLLSAQVRIKAILYIGAALPVVYWVGVVAFFPRLGLEAFAIFKFISFSLMGIVYLKITLRYLDLSLYGFFTRFVLKNILPFIFLCGVLYLLRSSLPLHKDKLGLLQVISMGAAVGIVSMGLAYLFNSDSRALYKFLGK